MLALPVSIILLIVLGILLPDPWSIAPAIMALLCLLAYGVMLPCCLLRHYWRRPNIVLLIAWAPFGWLGGYPTSIWLLYVAQTLKFSMSQYQLATALWMFLLVPAAVALFIFFLRKSRSDTFMLCTLAWPAVLLTSGILELVATGLGLESNEIREHTLPPFAIVFYALMLTLPAAIGLIILKAKSLYGTTPSSITTH